MELPVVGTPKGVDFAAATGRYDDDVNSKQDRANDDRNIMYVGCDSKQYRNGLTRSISAEEHEVPTASRAYLLRSSLFAHRRFLEKRAHKMPKIIFCVIVVENHQARPKETT